MAESRLNSRLLRFFVPHYQNIATKSAQSQQITALVTRHRKVINSLQAQGGLNP